MRIVIELKRDANPQVVLNRLFAQTQLQTSFAINMLALVNNQSQPKILSLRHIIDEYLAFQEEVIIRRTKYDLRKAQERAHLLEGLLVAQDNIDEVIKIIRSSYDNAKENLMSRFGLDDVQAQAILDMRLKALQGLDREKLEAEYKELEEKIAYFNQLLSSDELLRKVLKEELQAISDKFGDDRVTEIQDVEDEIDIEDLIEEEQCVFTLTQAGYIKRTPASEYTAQSKGGMGKKGITTREEDYVVDVFTASTHDYILFFTDTGKVYRKKGYQIPESGKAAKGTNIVNILQVEQGERIQAMIHTRSIEDDGRFLFMVTRNGTVKRLPANTLKNLRNNGIRALRMEEGDQLIAVRETDGSQKILIATHDGMAVCFDENDVGPLLFFILFNAVRLLTRYYGVAYGYRKGVDIVKDMGGGFLQKLTEGASILGLFVMGALVNKWTHVNIPMVVSKITGSDGQVHVTTVQTILDQLMPGLVPLLLTFACMWLLRKKVNPLWIIVGFFVIGIAGYAVGLLGL